LVFGAPRAEGAAVDADLWARLAALEGQVLVSGNGRRLWVVAVTHEGVYVRSGAQPATLLGRRALEEALPHVAAGEPLPHPFGTRAARLRAVLRAAGVGPGA
jgi:hypothetical protein